MAQRDEQICELTCQGLSARKIRERLKLTITVRSIQRVQRYMYGKTNPFNRNNSTEYQLDINMRPYVEECLRRLGKDPFLCENCGERQTKKCDIHHTKYEGATIYDLQYVCRSCNLARANVGLA